MLEFKDLNGRNITSLTIHNGSFVHLLMGDIGHVKDRIHLVSSSTSIISATLGAMMDGPRGVWKIAINAKGVGMAEVDIQISGKSVAKFPVQVVTKVDLPHLGSNAGLWSRIFLSEVSAPDNPRFTNLSDAKMCMEYIKLVVCNQLKHPKLFGNASAKTIKDMVTTPSNIKGYERYPAISGQQISLIQNIVKIANDDGDKRQPSFLEFVNLAIEVANRTTVILDPSPVGLYGWRTKGHQSPGNNYVSFGRALCGNQFYSLKADVIQIANPKNVKILNNLRKTNLHHFN